MGYQDKSFPPEADQPMAGKYINGEAYDKRGESSILENYVLGLWQPFLKKIISDLSAGKIMVDLGCGTGEYIQMAKNAEKIYAVDISSEMLRVCREKMKGFPRIEIINSSISDINLPPVDLVVAIGVWEYIDPIVLFNKIKEITHQGSKVIVVFPNIYNALNLVRSLGRMKKIALRPGFIKNFFRQEFSLLDSVSFGEVFWFPKRFQFLVKPIWELKDWLWRPFQKFLFLGVNVYYLFERK